MYSFMQCFYWIEVYNLVVLGYFKDIMKACNFWTEDTVLYALGLFQLFTRPVSAIQCNNQTN